MPSYSADGGFCGLSPGPFRFPLFGGLIVLGRLAVLAALVAEPVTAAGDRDDLGVVQEAVEDRRGRWARRRSVCPNPPRGGCWSSSSNGSRNAA